MLHTIVNTYREAYRGLPREVWILSCVMFVNRVGTMVLPFLTLYFTSQGKYSPSQAGRLVGLWGMGSILGSFLGGRLTSRFGAIPVQKISLFLSGPAYLMILAAESPISLALTIFTASVISESFRPASVTATTEVCPPKLHARALALNRLAINLGMTFGPAVGGFLAIKAYALLFYVEAATCFAAGVFLAFAFRRPRKLHHEVDATDPSSPPRSPLKDLRFVGSLFLLILSAMVFFQLTSTYPLYLRDHYGLHESDFGLLISINTIIIVVIEMVLIHKIERVNKLRAVAWGNFLIALGFGILPFGTSFAFCMFSLVLWTFGEMLSMPVMAAYVANRATPRNRGNYMGYYVMSFSIALVIAPWLGTRLYEIKPELVWYSCLGIGVIVLVGFYALSNEKPAVEPESPAPHSPNA